VAGKERCDARNGGEKATRTKNLAGLNASLGKEGLLSSAATSGDFVCSVTEVAVVVAGRRLMLSSPASAAVSSCFVP
jgi:hypothetical protein